MNSPLFEQFFAEFAAGEERVLTCEYHAPSDKYRIIDHTDKYGQYLWARDVRMLSGENVEVNNPRRNDTSFSPANLRKIAVAGNMDNAMYKLTVTDLPKILGIRFERGCHDPNQFVFARTWLTRFLNWRMENGV